MEEPAQACDHAADTLADKSRRYLRRRTQSATAHREILLQHKTRPQSRESRRGRQAARAFSDRRSSMARLGRTFLPDQPLHVISRGNNRGAVLFGEDGYAQYAGWLAEAVDGHGCRIHAQVFTPGSS
jgi:hypothetical protein